MAALPPGRFAKALFNKDRNIRDSARRMFGIFAQLNPIEVFDLNSEGQQSHGIQTQIFCKATVGAHLFFNAAMLAQRVDYGGFNLGFT
jgi:hypothetical protein